MSEQLSTPSAAHSSPPRIRDSQRTRAAILAVATEEFARQSYTGARVDEIAARTNTTKRMIYYYFGGKENLYIAVLEDAYGKQRAVEQTIDLAHLSPAGAMRALAEFTFDWEEANPHLVRLVTIENVHRAEHIRASAQLRGLNSPVLDLIDAILERGRADGTFLRDVRAIDVHVMMSALCFFRVSNRDTINALFDHDMGHPDQLRRHRRIVADMILAWLETSAEERS